VYLCAEAGPSQVGEVEVRQRPPMGDRWYRAGVAQPQMADGPKESLLRSQVGPPRTGRQWLGGAAVSGILPLVVCRCVVVKVVAEMCHPLPVAENVLPHPPSRRECSRLSADGSVRRQVVEKMLTPEQAEVVNGIRYIYI